MKNIEFIPSSKESELVVPYPKPAKNYIPDWFKDIKSDVSYLKFKDNFVSNKTAKMCMPFMDSFLTGYIQESWTDIYINPLENGTVEYNYASLPKIMSHREKTTVNVKEMFYDIEFTWIEQWIPKLPKGYSMLYIHPLNRSFDLPFYSLSAVVDSDKYYHSFNGNYPFYIKKHFSGLIPAGTPLYQMIPIKRDYWKSILKKFNSEKKYILENEILKNFISSYKKNFWQKKDYS